MNTLSEVVKKYLDANGITVTRFADYIGCEFTKCSKWFKGERKLNSDQIRKTHEFLQGKHIKTVEEIMSMKGE